MKLKLFYPLVTFLALVVIDQVLKNYYFSQGDFQFNEGIIFGFASDLPSFVRVVLLGSFFGFIFSLFLLTLYLLPSSLVVLRFGLSLFCSGIFGNVMDRVRLGKTIDFIPITSLIDGTYFNTADIFIWIGFFIIFFHLTFHNKRLWVVDNQRGNYLVNPLEQKKFSLKLSLIVFCSSLLLGLLAYSYFHDILNSLKIEGKDKLMLVYFISHFFITLIFIILVYAAGIIISHKYAGPIYALERFVDDLIQGKESRLVLREGDNYKNLETIAKKLTDNFKLKNKS